MKNVLVQYIESHLFTWKEDLEEAPYNLVIKQGKGALSEYFIFNYNQIKSDLSIPLVQQSRGIILKIVSEGYSNLNYSNFFLLASSKVSVVCHAFNKFFNYGEPNAHNIDFSTARIQEKVDGSIIKLWYDNADWHVSTNGMIDAFETDLQLPTDEFKSFGDIFMKAWARSPHGNGDFTDACSRGDYKSLTYIFELVSPWNRIVVPYADIEIYLIGVRDNLTDEELDPNYLELHFKRPKVYSFGTFEEVVANAAVLPFDQEGYVVVDANWNRVKIKSLQYLAAHHLKNNGVVSRDRALTLIKMGEQEEFLSYFPEYSDIFKEIEIEYENHLRAISSVQQWVASKKESGLTKKEFALEVMNSWLKPYLRSISFALWEGKDIQPFLDKIDYEKMTN